MAPFFSSLKVLKVLKVLKDSKPPKLLTFSLLSPCCGELVAVDELCGCASFLR